MSRIHEALKRAEEQKAAANGRRGETSTSDAGSAEPEAQAQAEAKVEEVASPELAGHVPAYTETLAQETASPASPTSFDSLLTRCGQSQWKPDTKTMLFFDGDEQAAGTEEFRTLRSRLYQLRERMALKKVLVSSALPKEGKSFVAANLAQVMVRQPGRRALLIDADLRGPRLHAALGTTSEPGLAEYLMGESDEFAILQRGTMENLFFIPAGRPVLSPAELLTNGRLKALLQRMEEVFDWIIVDSPPAVPVSDAGLLASLCDGVLMVIRSSATPFDAARKARQEFDGRTLVGVVLNGAPSESAYQRYYYAAYERRAPEQRG